MREALHGHVVVPEEVLAHLEEGPDDGHALLAAPGRSVGAVVEGLGHVHLAHVGAVDVRAHILALDDEGELRGGVGALRDAREGDRLSGGGVPAPVRVGLDEQLVSLVVDRAEEGIRVSRTKTRFFGLFVLFTTKSSIHWECLVASLLNCWTDWTVLAT